LKPRYLRLRGKCKASGYKVIYAWPGHFSPKKPIQIKLAKFRNYSYTNIVKEKQRTYKIDPITVNEIKVVQVVVDAHYEEKHQDSISDDLILKLVKELDGRHELPETKTGQYSYFATLIELDEKQYRLIWLLEDHAIYIGVVNAYRDQRRS
jgi:hypothetical protein